jgi:hypothetical protein
VDLRTPGAPSMHRPPLSSIRSPLAWSWCECRSGQHRRSMFIVRRKDLTLNGATDASSAMALWASG